MATVTAKRPRVKPVRSVRVSIPATPDNPAFIITIVEGRKTADYHVQPINSDYGRAFVVEKIFCPDGNSYAVNLCGPASSCECIGYLRHWHCRHLEALTALRQAGKL